jgi:hypothetical protein
VRRNMVLFAFGDANQTVAGDNQTLSGLKDIAEADQLRQMLRRHGWIFRGDRDFDQGGEFFRRKKFGSVNSHRLLAVHITGSPATPGNEAASDHSIYF